MKRTALANARIVAQRRAAPMKEFEIDELEEELARSDYLPTRPRMALVRLIATVRMLRAKPPTVEER